MNSQLWRWCHLDYFQRHWDHHKFSHGCQPTACSWGRFSAIQLGGWDASGEADWEQGKREGEKTGGRAKDCWLPALSLVVPLCSVARRLGNIFITLDHLILWSRLALQVIALPPLLWARPCLTLPHFLFLHPDFLSVLITWKMNSKP